MKHNKYKILVLSDLKKSAKSVLKSTVSLAKMIDGEITLFHVIKPTDVVERDSQLSAMRSINKEHVVTNKNIENLVMPIAKDFDLNIDYKFAFGNLKHEIEAYIDQYQPDIIVLGKRKPKALKLTGDNLIDFVLKKHKGVIMIATEENSLQPNQDISLGILNQDKNVPNINFVTELINQSQQPLKSFKVANTSNTIQNVETISNKETIEYVFEKGDNAINNISKYASKNNINLMCVDTIRQNKNP